MKAVDRIAVYKENKSNREQGVFNGIPIFKQFPRFGELIPTIPRATQIMITANSGVGKTNLWIGFLLYPSYKLMKSEGLKVKFLICLLEDPIEKFIDSLFSLVLFDKFNIVADGLTLNSMRENPLSKEVEDILEEAGAIVDDLLSYCEILDSTYNPTGIYKWCRHWSEQLGTHHEKTIVISGEDRKVYSHYEPNDLDLQVLLFVDNLNNLDQEKDEGRLLTERETINRWSRKYCRLQMYKHWKWTIVNILQQASDSEKQQFTNTGSSIIEKIEPSLDGLGNSKECQRDHFIIIGLFAPSRYGLKSYFEYDIVALKDTFRAIKVLKSNISATNDRIPLFFKGACNYFSELPKPADMNQDIYNSIRDGKYK